MARTREPVVNDLQVTQPSYPGNEYESVDFPGGTDMTGDTTNAVSPLYETPDLDTTPRSGEISMEDQSGGNNGDIPLYAMPDKRPRSARNTMEVPKKLEDTSIVDVSLLYAQVDKTRKET